MRADVCRVVVIPEKLHAVSPIKRITVYQGVKGWPMKRWIVADDEVVSTETLVRAMAAAMNLRARVVHLPDTKLRSKR